MIPKNVFTSVKAAFEAYYQARSEELDRQIVIAENQMAVENLGNSGAVPQRLREIYRDTLRDCKSNLLSSFEGTLEVYDVRSESGDSQTVVDMIRDSLQPLASEFNQRLIRAANNAGVPLDKNLDNEVARLLTEAKVEVDLLLGRLELKEVSGQEKLYAGGSSETPEQKPTLWKRFRKPLLAAIGTIIVAGIIAAINPWIAYFFGPSKDGGPQDKTPALKKQIASIEFENASPFVDQAVIGTGEIGNYWRVYYFKVQIHNRSYDSTIRVKHFKLTELRQLDGDVFKPWDDAEPVFLEWDATKPKEIPPQDKILVPFARVFPPKAQMKTDKVLSGDINIPQLRFTVKMGGWPKRMISHVPPGTHRFRLKVFFEKTPPADTELELDWPGKQRKNVKSMVQEIKIRKLKIEK